MVGVRLDGMRGDAEASRRLLDRILAGVPSGESPLTHVADLAARESRHTDWPEWADPGVLDALAAAGVKLPWTHQVEAADLAHAGRHVVVSTGTGSGKSIAYQLPVLTALAQDPKATALYLAPTKALGADQLGAVHGLELPEVRAATYDGDTPMAERDWVRAYARWVFTNPDMLHRGILPSHARWARLFRRLSYVVIDECHAYRGVFGSHVALLMRRLRRVAARYGANPVFVMASATVAEPAELGTRLTGLPCAAVTEDGSPRGARTIALWEPPLTDLLGEHGSPVRRSAGAEASRIMADLVVEGARTLAFVRSRHGAELTALGAKRLLSEVSHAAGPPGRRLPRRLPRRRTGASSNANSTPANCSAWPARTRWNSASTSPAWTRCWSPASPAPSPRSGSRPAGPGRSGGGALVVFVARDDPLDTYLVHHPAAVLDRPVEATVLDPTNPYVLAPQLCCAAAEMALTDDCLADFGGAAAREVDRGPGRGRHPAPQRQTGWYWTSPRTSARQRRHPRLRRRTDRRRRRRLRAAARHRRRRIGLPVRARRRRLPAPGRVLRGRRTRPGIRHRVGTRGKPGLDHLTAQHRGHLGGAAAGGTRVRRGADRARRGRGVPHRSSATCADCPAARCSTRSRWTCRCERLHTRAVWYTISNELLCGSAPGRAGLTPARIPGALHAAEHAAIGLLPLFATCDRWDIGGVSTALHEDTGEATVFVHDGHPGGAGFADRGYAALVPWLAATREAIFSCECSAGCPSCVQSPKCGNGNEPLDKAGAVAVLDAVLAAIS